MTKLWLLIGPIALSSCIAMPILLTLEEEIVFEESKMVEIQSKILAELKKHDAGFGVINPGDKSTCQTRYNNWVTKKINEGFLPADLVLSTEYTEDPTNTNCAPADFTKIYKESLETASATDMDINKFDFKSEAEKLEELKCSNAFRDPKKKKIKITGIQMNIIENSLTQDFSPMEIYASDEEIDDDVLKKDDAKDELIEDNLIHLLASTTTIEPKTTGKKDLKLNKDAKEFKKAQDAIIPLKGLVLVIPGQISSEPKIIKINDRNHFVVPKGSLRALVTIKTDLNFQFADAKCSINDFYNDIEESNKAQP